MGVSLWLVPAAVQMGIVKSALPRCTSVDHPLSPTSYPTFQPHITLATVPFTSPDILDMLFDAVPKHQQPIRANFQSLVVGDHYFRSVFIDIEPTRELVDLQSQVLTSLRRRGLEPSSPRFPHMSLCYITDEDKSHRDGTAQVLRDTGVVREIVDTQCISLQCGDVSLLGFDGTEIWLAKCDGLVETWEVDERKVQLDPEF